MLKRLAVLTLISSLLAMPSHAKDMRHRLGIGIKNNTSFDLPALAAVYYPAAELAVTGGLGTDTKKDNSLFTLNTGVRRLLFYEDRMNFYFGGQVGLVNYEIGGDKQSGWELNAIFGTEFFFSGLDNLAFTFEGGVGVVSMKEVRFRTIADHPLKAGILFYF